MISDLTIQALNTAAQQPFGCSSSQSPCVNSFAERIHIVGRYDGIYIKNSTACSLTMVDSVIDSAGDTVNQLTNSGHVTTLRRVLLRCIGDTTTLFTPTGVASNCGHLYCYDCHIQAFANVNGIGAADGIRVELGQTPAVIELHNTTITMGSDDPTNVLSIFRLANNSILNLVSCDYDRTLTSVLGTGGVVSDTPVHATNSNGAALGTNANQTSILTAVNAITTNTARSMPVIPPWFVRPTAGTTSYEIMVYLYSLQGNLEDVNAQTVTVHARTASGVSLDANLGSTTMTRLSTGKYTVAYSVSSAHDLEAVYFDFSWTVAATPWRTAWPPRSATSRRPTFRRIPSPRPSGPTASAPSAATN